MAVGGESHGSNARGVDDAAHAVLARGFQNCARAVDVGAIHFLRIAQPEPVVGGDVKYGVAPGHGFLQRRRVAKIAGCGFGFQAFEILEIASGADEQAQLRTLLG